MINEYVRLKETVVEEMPSREGSPELVQTISNNNSEGRALASTTTTTTTITSINIEHSNDINIGDTFITRTVYNEEVVTTRLLCLQFKFGESFKKFRCSVAVFLCWTFFVTCSVAAYIIIFIIPQHRTLLDIGLSVPWYLRRGDWQAMPAYDQEFLHLPVKYVIIAHTEFKTEYCNQKYACMQTVINVQEAQLRSGYPDIVGNYLVGGNGWVFEGAGSNVKSSYKLGWESWEDKSISILFLGNYELNIPDQVQFDHVGMLLDVLVQKGVLHKDYELYGSCQVSSYTNSKNLRKKLHLFSHWKSENSTRCLPELSTYE